MAIKTILKDITTVTRGIIIHGCNAQGVMGSGVALALKNKWPEIFGPYQNRVSKVRANIVNQLTTQNAITLDSHEFVSSEAWKVLRGTMVSVRPKLEPDVIIVNAFTQNFFGSSTPDADLGAIVEAFNSLCYTITNFYTPPHGMDRPIVYLPKIGSLRGGLDWDTQVLPALEHVASRFPNIDFVVCVVDSE